MLVNLIKDTVICHLFTKFLICAVGKLLCPLMPTLLNFATSIAYVSIQSEKFAARKALNCRMEIKYANTFTI